MSSGMLYKLLANPIYIGKLRHKGTIYDGEHDAMVDVKLFDAVQERLKIGAVVPKGSTPHRDTHLLTGILFDDTGDRMAPTHGKANGRRYRYYISGRIRRSAKAVPESWRIPTPDIEKVIQSYAMQLLRNKSLLADWIQRHASADMIPSCLRRTEKLIAALSDQTPQYDSRRSVLRLLFQSITLTTSAIRFEVKASEIAKWLLASLDTSSLSRGSQAACAKDQDTGTIAQIAAFEHPITLRRRGVGMRIIIESPYLQPPEPDQPLVDIIARAHLYLDHLTKSPDMSTNAVASTFNVDRADVGRILPLAFLSPAMLDAILTGRQSPSLTARRLARMDLPLLWSEQEAALQ
jgi:hypothetical protein